MCYLDDRRDELDYKVVFQEIRPVRVEEVDDEAFDVRAILILVGHYHHFAIPVNKKGHLLYDDRHTD